jgi:glycerophosphoryl diester phosphodiesterase
VGMPQVVAHRGASVAAPEHTLSAYEFAVSAGAEALECDVRLTADGHLVCVHDRRIDRTSSGCGLVSTATLAQLNSHDFGSWHDTWADFEDPPDFDESRRRVLTLERLLELADATGVDLAIETKHPTRYGGLVEVRVVELLEHFGLARPPRDGHSQVRVMSFSQQAMRFRTGELPFGSRIAGPGIPIIRAHPEFVAREHALGHQVHVWTVDSVSDVDLCAELGVDAIITNRPGEVLGRLTAVRPETRH